MIHYLIQAYPLRRTTRSDLLYCFGAGFFVAWFLVVFQPNDTDDWTHPYKYHFLWGYGLVIFLVLALMRFVLPPLLPKVFNEQKWTVGKHILYLLFSFSLAVVACYLYFNWFMGYPFTWGQLFYFSGVGATIGVFPLSAYVLLDYIRQLKKYQSGAAQFNQSHTDQELKKENHTAIHFNDESGKTQLQLATDTILYLQSSLNYVEIFYLEEEKLKKELLRNNLKKLESELPNPPFIRTHRSFLVNLDKVTSLSGNAQGYQLQLDFEEIQVPVSRSQSKKVLAALD